MNSLEHLLFANSSRIIFAVRGQMGAVHYWREWGRDNVEDWGGVEFHWRPEFKPEPFGHAHHKDCFLIGECWHDGSSLMFEEWEPIYQDCSTCGKWDAMYRRLERMCRERIETSDDQTKR